MDGPEADLSVTEGLASRLNQVLNRYLDPIKGRFKTIDETYQQNVKDIDASITRQNDVLDTQKNYLLEQFTAMETTIGRLKSLGDQLTAQLGSLTTSR